jgi:hypothetical protein
VAPPARWAQSARPGDSSWTPSTWAKAFSWQRADARAHVPDWPWS